MRLVALVTVIFALPLAGCLADAPATPAAAAASRDAWAFTFDFDCPAPQSCDKSSEESFEVPPGFRWADLTVSVSSREVSWDPAYHVIVVHDVNGQHAILECGHGSLAPATAPGDAEGCEARGGGSAGTWTVQARAQGDALIDVSIRFE